MYKRLFNGMLIEEAVRHFHTHSWKASYSRSTRASGMWICCVVHRCITVSREQQMRSCLSFSRMGLRDAELVGMSPNYWSFFALFSIPIVSTARQDSSQVTCCFHLFNNWLRCMPCPQVRIAVKVAVEHEGNIEYVARSFNFYISIKH